MQFLSFGGASDRQSKGYLTGTIPTELGKLSKMQFFSIYPGRIGGGLPASLANWTSLSLFLIFSNDIGGTVPPGYGNFTKLETLCLDNAALEGAITHIDWSRMPSLKFFNLARNDMVGEIPESLGSLVQLEDISLNGNRMTGRIPKTLKNCTKLQWLFLQVNELTGDIADVFDSLVPAGGGVSAITGLLLGRNNFTGILPDWLPILENLRILVVDGNELEGTMPSSIANMTTFKNPNNGNVEILLRSNLPGTIEVQIKGVYQSYYSIVSSLTVLDLSANKLTGGIPLEFGTMQGLHYLNLSSNLLTGSIPAALGGMGELNQMDLSYNNFTGAIPEELATLSKLESFNVSYNDLSGPIPEDHSSRPSQHLSMGTRVYVESHPLCNAVQLLQRIVPRGTEVLQCLL